MVADAISDTTTRSAGSNWELHDSVISDAELTALALAADPDLPLDRDAVPLPVYLSQGRALLPDWYMPQAMAPSGNRWRTLVVLTIIFAFLFIEALGLCSTYGQLHLP
jgi:hypothetical protein